MNQKFKSLKYFDSPSDIKLPYNTAYYNFGLLQDLDYVIGGYGPADHQFIFNLNSFVEAYILNEEFLVSKQEWDHHFCTTKEIFTNGKPITHLVITNKKGCKYIGWPQWIDKGIVKYVRT